MLRLSLEAIQIVDAIERHGSFSAAADTLHKVPSTISYTVGRLEAQLGVRLFDRRGTRVTLTASGAELLREGRWLLAAAGDLESRLRRIATGYEAELRLVHDSLLPTASLSEDVRAFEAMHCGTRLRIGCETLTGTWEALREGRADLVLAVGEGPAGGGYRALAVGQVDFVFCVAPDHPLARQPGPLSREHLAAHPAIAVADSARVLPARTIGLRSGQSRITVPDITAKLAFQQAGLGHGFLPRAIAARALAEGRLVEREIEEPRSAETLWLAWDAGSSGEALKWWRERLQSRPLL